MSLIKSETIRDIEEKITSKIIKEYNISTECLLFDNTNFISYINADAPSRLAQRGKSKEHSSDLKIVGLSLMVSPDYNIPLFHEPCPGNANDAKRFSEIISLLKSRCQSIRKSYDLTLVFDRGNNSSSNIEKLIEDDPFAFHYVGGLKHNQCSDLLLIPKTDFTPLKGESFKGATAYRTAKNEFGRDVAVVITSNPELYALQMRSVLNNISKCTLELSELSQILKEREDGKPRRGRQYTVESVESRVKNILSAEHMKAIFDFDIDRVDNIITLKFGVNEDKFDKLKEHTLGKSVLFTDRHEWTNEQIVGAYRSQYHVEECFKQLKNKEHLSFVPIRHFTDSHIAVHAFYCVLALTLTSVLNLEYSKISGKISIAEMLAELTKLEQVTNYYIISTTKIKKTQTFSKSSNNAEEYCKKFDLYKYANK